MVGYSRTDANNEYFRALVEKLDADLAVRDGKDHSFYAPFNTLDRINHAVLAFDAGIPVGCGAIKAYDQENMEVKRMYVVPGRRAEGIASGILRELETWASELGYLKCLLETGKKQPEALALYRKHGYLMIPNYGQYQNIDNSVCFEKYLGTV